MAFVRVFIEGRSTIEPGALQSLTVSYQYNTSCSRPLCISSSYIVAALPCPYWRSAVHPWWGLPYVPHTLWKAQQALTHKSSLRAHWSLSGVVAMWMLEGNKGAGVGTEWRHLVHSTSWYWLLPTSISLTYVMVKSTKRTYKDTIPHGWWRRHSNRKWSM